MVSPGGTICKIVRGVERGTIFVEVPKKYRGTLLKWKLTHVVAVCAKEENYSTRDSNDEIFLKEEGVGIDLREEKMGGRG